jgi:hypothetical protein
MSIAKQTKPKKFPTLVYPKDALDNPQWNPDNYPLWTPPKDWSKVDTVTVAVRKEEAFAMLERANPANAGRLRKSWALQFTGSANDGNFSFMDNVEFDINGQLGNGEHRLRGISASNGIVLMNIAYGRNPANYYKYDYVYNRTGGNLVGIWAYDESGRKVALPKRDQDSVSAGASWCIYYWEVVSLEERLKITPTMRIDWVTKTPSILPNLKTIRNYFELAGMDKVAKQPCAESILLALLTLGSDVNLTKTREFIKGVILGEGDTWYTGSPVKVYREFLDNAKAAKGKGRVYNSYKFGQGLYALRMFLDGLDIDKGSKGYVLKYKPGKEKNVPRLSTGHEESVAWMRREMREEKRNKLILLLDQPTVNLTPVAKLTEGKFFSKMTVKGLAKLGIVTIADILAFNEVGLRAVLKAKSIDEVKDVLAALDLQLKR